MIPLSNEEAKKVMDKVDAAEGCKEPLPVVKLGMPAVFKTDPRGCMALLRPSKQPLYDAEWLMPNMPISGVYMFERQCGQPFVYGSPGKNEKDKTHTMLNQSGMLDAPCEMSVCGFNYATNEDISPEDHAKISTGLFTYIHCGQRIYLDCPIVGMPSERHRNTPVSQIMTRIIRDKGKASEHIIEITPEKIRQEEKALRAEIAKEIEDDKMFGFTIGGSALRLSPLESFGVRYSWPKPIILSKPVLLYAFIEGLFWSPM